MLRNFFRPKSSYKKREVVLDIREATFFIEFLKQLPVDFYIFPKMRIADIVETTSGHGYYHERNMILPKHIDFLITSLDFRPILAIELNGTSHNRLDRKESDHEKKSVLDFVGLPLEFINVGTNFSQDIESLIKKYLTQK